jgi:uncharacterized protein (TIGR03437 family)
MSKLVIFAVCLFAFTAGQANGQITQVATLPVSTTFPITGQVPNGLSFALWNSKSNELYTSYTNTIQVYDTSNSDPTGWSLKTTIQLPFSVLAMAMSKDGLLAIANQQTDIGKSTKSLTLVDPVSGQQRSIGFGDYIAASACTFSSDGKTLYAEAQQQVPPFKESIYAVDVSSGEEIYAWKAQGNNALNLQATSNGKLWELAENEVPAPEITTNMLVVYNPDGSQGALDLGFQPLALNVDPNGTNVYVTGEIPFNGSSHLVVGSIVVIDPATNQVVRTISNELPSFMAWPSKDANFAYIVWYPSNSLIALNLAASTQNQVFYVDPGKTMHGLATRRLADGSDQIVTLRDGELDVYAATQPPLVYSVVNGASFQAGPLAPGENITIFGSALGYVGQADSTGLQILTTMGATSVSLDGKPLRLNYVGYAQVNAYMPQSVSNGNHSLSVKVGASTQSQQVTVVDQNLALFQFVPDPIRAPGVTFPILMDAGYHILGDPTVPNPESQSSGYAQVSRGDTAIAWATGGGLTNPPISDSDVSPGGLHPLVVTPAMTACGVPVALSYSGRAPSFPSLDQFNFVVPGVCQSGANDLTLGPQRYNGALWVK